METSEGVANFFIAKAEGGACTDLTQLKLQKIVYYAHGWHLGLSGLPLFVEPVQAWRYGPVIESLRSEFRLCGNLPITRKARDIRLEKGVLVEREFSLNDQNAMPPFLSRVWDEYHKFTAVQLMNMTHEVGSPWHQIASHYNFRIPPGTTIPNELIRDYFRAIAESQSKAN